MPSRACFCSGGVLEVPRPMEDGGSSSRSNRGRRRYVHLALRVWKAWKLSTRRSRLFNASRNGLAFRRPMRPHLKRLITSIFAQRSTPITTASTRAHEPRGPRPIHLAMKRLRLPGDFRKQHSTYISNGPFSQWTAASTGTAVHSQGREPPAYGSIRRLRSLR